ncbi:DUF309 domain-containing protein (plasmid) [Bacillus sp. 31A1R]|uniref:DUF309 domain-containing protein n=1 Tax=Robertmurraya mangrovi TaxID=3098077 RepID=A0ABU5IVH9_9BACI|nr:DUF309 domain-containing protein [Bacillus sp. 31A1R]MDZ5471143.1 DUF309 domain-containing protein [Bacillus sp. 31A1R]
MYAQEYIDYLVHFHGDRDYFECHEILEEYWKKVDRGNKESILVGFILLAVSTYHHRRNNFSGAVRTLIKATEIFKKQEQKIHSFGLDKEGFFILIQERLKLMEAQKPYDSMNLPIGDAQLIEACIRTCRMKGFTWGTESDLTNEELIHRHSTRDRSDVIQERMQSLKNKQNKSRE